MDTNDKTKCECYCHKKGAHCCDGGSGSCALCGEISDWAIKELVPPPVTASLETGGETNWEEEFEIFTQDYEDVFNQYVCCSGGVKGDVDCACNGILWKEKIKDFISHTNASVTEQTERKVREEVMREEYQFFKNILDGYDIANKGIGVGEAGTKSIRFALQSRLAGHCISLSEPLEKEQ